MLRSKIKNLVSLTLLGTFLPYFYFAPFFPSDSPPVIESEKSWKDFLSSEAIQTLPQSSPKVTEESLRNQLSLIFSKPAEFTGSPVKATTPAAASTFTSQPVKMNEKKKLSPPEEKRKTEQEKRWAQIQKAKEEKKIRDQLEALPYPTPTNSKLTKEIGNDNLAAYRKQNRKICIITLYDDSVEHRLGDIVNMSLKNKEMYARLHNYEFKVDNHMWVNRSRPIAWSKLLGIRARLMEYEWVMWIDLDTIIMNMGLNLESLLDPKYDFIVSKDNAGLNSGVMLWRNTTWSRDFLLEAYNQNQFLSSIEIYEQRAIVHVLSKNFTRSNDHVKYIHQQLLNSYTNFHRRAHHYKKGDFIIHFAGCRFIKLCKKKI